jgi:outer membrane protein assembly factor BamC
MTLSSQRAVRGVSVFFLCAAVAGCGAFLSKDKIDYKTVATQRPLDVPPDLSQLPREDRFAVPDRPGVASAAAGAAGATGGSVRTAAAGAVAPGGPTARIERAGTQRWLSVDVAPEQAFAVVRDFWPSVGLKLEREEPQVGIVETVWAENRAKLPQDVIRRTIGRVFDNLYSTGEQDKYRTRIERTAKNTSEIFISHRGMIEVYTSPAKDQTRWQPRDADTELEAEMLQRLLLRFTQPVTQTATAAATPGAPAATVAAAPPASAAVTKIVPAAGAGDAAIEVNEPFDRAWRRVGLGLDRGGFTVEDRDRTKGIYFVRYLDPEYEAREREKQGFFSKIFGQDFKVDAQQFRVVVQAAGDVSKVTIQDRDGKPDTGATAGKIVKQLSEQLR